MKNIFGLNLQLFAEPVVNTTADGSVNSNPVENGVQAYGGTGMTAETKTFYDKNLIAMAGPTWCTTNWRKNAPFLRETAKAWNSAALNPCPKPRSLLPKG